jgi:hypothetical protein
LWRPGRVAVVSELLEERDEAAEQVRDWRRVRVGKRARSSSDGNGGWLAGVVPSARGVGVGRSASPAMYVCRCVVEPRAASIALPGVGAALPLPPRGHAANHRRGVRVLARFPASSRAAFRGSFSTFRLVQWSSSTAHRFDCWHAVKTGTAPCSVSENLCVLWERCRQTAR